MSSVLAATLFLPWFRLEAWEIPLGPVTLPIQPFGVLVAIGVLLGARRIERYAREEGFAPSVAADFFTHTILTAFVFAFLLNGIFYHPEAIRLLLDDPGRLFSNEGWLGLSSYGGFVGAAAGALLWKIRRKLPLMPVADAGAFAFPLGWLWGRTGCFVVHDHPGIVSDFPLAVADYQVGAPPFEPRHDLALYEILWAALILGLFYFLRRKTRPAGFYFGLLPVLYAPIRFFLDFLRADVAEGGDIRYAGLTPAQYASIGLVAAGAWILVRAYTREGTPMPEELRWPPPLESSEVEEEATAQTAAQPPLEPEEATDATDGAAAPTDGAAAATEATTGIERDATGPAEADEPLPDGKSDEKTAESR